MDIQFLVNGPSPEPIQRCPHTKKRRLSLADDHYTTKTPPENSDDAYDSVSSAFSSCRSTATSISSCNSPSPESKTDSPESKADGPDLDDQLAEHIDGSPFRNSTQLLAALSRNRSVLVHVKGVRFADFDLLKDHLHMERPEEDLDIRQVLVGRIHDGYVKPLLDLTGYKWVKKEVPSKGRGLKVFSIKYACSQHLKRECENYDDDCNERARQLTHPLKEFNCESEYSIKYTWSTRSVEVNYRHLCHPPYRRLPEVLKPFILQRLDMKALDLYREILENDQFGAIKHLIYFNKVQSFWSKERTKKKEQSTKEAFKSFFERDVC